MRLKVLEFTVMREVLASLFDETPVATLLCEPSALRVVAANTAAEVLFACPATALGSSAWSSLTDDAETIERALQTALDGTRSALELEVRMRDGSHLHAFCDVLPARIGTHVAGAFVQLRTQGQALSDPLTGLPGTTVLADRVEQALVTARRYRYRFALIEADVDGFTSITERYGTAAGNWVLRIIGQRVRDTLRASDTVVRVEADRFAIVQPRVDGVDDAVDVAHKIIYAMHAPILLEGHALDVRMSLGIAVFPLDGERRESLIASADAALHEAKHHARGLLCLATNSAMEPAT